MHIRYPSVGWGMVGCGGFAQIETCPGISTWDWLSSAIALLNPEADAHPPAGSASLTHRKHLPLGYLLNHFVSSWCVFSSFQAPEDKLMTLCSCFHFSSNLWPITHSLMPCWLSACRCNSPKARVTCVGFVPFLINSIDALAVLTVGSWEMGLWITHRKCREEGRLAIFCLLMLL